MTQLSSPKNFVPPKDDVSVIIRLLEEKLAESRVFDKQSEGTQNIKRITIEGHYDQDDCREVCRQYKKAGWNDVMYRQVPFYGQTGKDPKETTFTFRVSKTS